MTEAQGHHPDSPPSDEQLIEAYRAGQSSAFATLVERYQKELFYFLMRFVGKASLADDLFQETFLQVHQSLDTFETSRRFRPWLFTIAANKARDQLRKDKRQRTVSYSRSLSGQGQADDQPGSFVDLLEADLPQPDDVAAAGELEASVKQVVDALPDHLREILLLAYFQQFPYKEIAEMLQIPLGTVKSRLHAAVASFAQIWKHRHEPPIEEVSSNR